MGRGLRLEAAVLAAAAACVTVAASIPSPLPLGYRAPALHVALETAAALVALLAAFLVYGRLAREPRVDDLLLACGLAVLALSNFGFRAVPAATGDRNDRVFVWAAVAGRLLGAGLLAVAAFAPGRRIRNGRRAASVATAAAVAVTAALLIPLVLAESRLPRAVTAPTTAARHPDLSGSHALLAVQVVGAVLYGAAVVGFLRRFERTGDELIRWLVLACVLSVFARVNYFLYPSNYSDWVYLGDAFGLLFFAVLLVGALREIVSYWRGFAEAAVLEERRRIAREFHDGLAQELAFIGRNLERVHAADGVLVERLRRSIARAQDESRRAITALSSRADVSVESLLRAAAEELADRLHVDIDLQVDGTAGLSPARAETVVRIASEAITNAARHSGATRVGVTLRRAGSRWVLSVRDDGCGFEPATRTGGYGLIAMRERAQAVGGEFALVSAPQQGTKVEVEFG